MYNLPEISHSSSINVEMTATESDVSHTPKTPEIINTLMAITDPLDDSLVKKEDSNVPKTPEIINSLMAITNPLDRYVADNSSDNTNSATNNLSTKPLSDNNNSDKPSVGSIQCSSAVQNMCSRLIKEELKVTLQRKRREHALSSSSSTCSADYFELSTMSDGSSNGKHNSRQFETESIGDTEEEDQEEGYSHSGTDLTEEDAEKRRKRRERNKIAATKCRLRKKEKTVNLVQESELLENQNCTLKSQIQDLEVQRRRLVDMLSLHNPICTKDLTVTPNSVTTVNATEFYSL